MFCNTGQKEFKKQMKKVLIFAPTAPTSGITQYILNILSALDTEKIHFDILSFKNHRLKSWCEEHGTEYFEFDISPYKQRKKYNNFLKDVFLRNYDVVYYNISTISNLQIFKSAKKYSNAKLIAHSHACGTESTSNAVRIVFSNLHKILRIFANKMFDKKCACSMIAAEWMFGKKNTKDVLVLENAIDVEKFKFNEEYKQEIKMALGIKTKYVVGHIGRFAPPKNHSFIIELFKELVNINNDCTLVLIGNGELENEIKQRVKENSLNEKIVFVDFQEDIFKYYSLFDLFLLPSLYEAFPITLVEAQANGLVSLVSDTVTTKCNLTGILEFMSLESPAKEWAQMLNNKLGTPRIDTSKIICEKGYSLEGQAKKLEDLLF
jgi:glycosyltransferase involved in cell wall biosynthesis